MFHNFRQKFLTMFKLHFRYHIRLLILSAIMALAFYIYFKEYPEYYFSFFPALFFIFMLLPVIIFVFLVNKSIDIKKFPTQYMASLTIKFFILAGVALYYKLSDGEMIISFLLSFFILYVVFQIYETTSILKFIKNKR